MELTFDKLTDENLILFAAKHYYKPRCIDVDEFYEDLKRIKYLKNLLTKYEKTGKLSERLILNHLIVLFNSFDIKPTLKILELKMKPSHWKYLKPFLIYLRYITNSEYTNIEMDKHVIEVLRKI